jgi:protein-arginine kinase activator protein McsA
MQETLYTLQLTILLLCRSCSHLPLNISEMRAIQMTIQKQVWLWLCGTNGFPTTTCYENSNVQRYNMYAGCSCLGLQEPTVTSMKQQRSIQWHMCPRCNGTLKSFPTTTWLWKQQRLTIQ